MVDVAINGETDVMQEKSLQTGVGLLETKRHLAGQRSQKKAAMMKSMVDWLT